MQSWLSAYSVVHFFTERLNEDQRKILSSSGKAKLLKSFTALETIIDSIKDGSINFSDFVFICDHRDEMLELCKLSLQLKNQVEDINELFDKREEQRRKYVTFHGIFSEFWSVCKESVQGRTILRLENPASVINDLTEICVLMK